MLRLRSPAELAASQAQLAASGNGTRPCVTVCGGTGCRVYGSEKVWTAFRDEIARQGADAEVAWDVKVTGCHGFCEKGPLVVLRPQGVLYTRVKPEDVPTIVSEALVRGRLVEPLLPTDLQSGQKIRREADLPFYKHQLRLILDLNGKIDPARLEEYIAHGGYASLAKVLTSLSPEQVIGKRADQRSDIFSLGVILYEMLCGTAPFNGENVTALMYQIVNFVCFSILHPAALGLEECCATGPGRAARYSTVTDFARFRGLSTSLPRSSAA